MRVAVGKPERDEDEVLFPAAVAARGKEKEGGEGDEVGPAGVAAVAGGLLGFLLGALVAPGLAALVGQLLPARWFQLAGVIVGALGGWVLWRERLAQLRFEGEEAEEDEAPPPGAAAPPPAAPPPAETTPQAP